jgi:hypothetical protein
MNIGIFTSLNFVFCIPFAKLLKHWAHENLGFTISRTAEIYIFAVD